MKTLPILKNIKQITKLENLGVTIEFNQQEEDISPFDHFDDNEIAQQICDKANNGNSAAWFCAKVTVKYKGFEEDDYLGCCSYSSFKEFTGTNKDYYQDMLNECIARINKDIEFANSQTVKFWDIRRAKNILSKYGLYIVSSNQLQTL